MKNPFKRNRKPEPKPDQGIDQATPSPSLGMHVFAIPASRFKPGTLLRLEEDGARIIESAWEVFKRLNVKLSIEFDPYISHDGRQYWEVTFTPEYYYRGKSYGVNGTKAVQEIGLVFPNEATEASDVRVMDDGRITWRTSWYPEPSQVEALVNEANRQVGEIIRDYGRTEAIMKVVKGAK